MIEPFRASPGVLRNMPILIIAAILAQPARGEFSAPTAITNVTIVSGLRAPMEAGTILIDEGRFAEVGTDVVIPAHADIVDGTGLIAYPGFIDAHSHLGMAATERDEKQRQRVEDEKLDPREGPAFTTGLANRRGILSHVRAAESYSPTEVNLTKARAAGLTAAVIAPQTGILSGTSAAIQLSNAPIRRSILQSDVGMHASFAPGEPGLYPKTLLGAIAHFRQVMLDAQHHARVQKYQQRHPITAKRVPFDAALDALKPALGREQQVIFEANSEDEIRRALKLADEFKLKPVISGAREAWKVTDLLKAANASLIVSMRFDKEPKGGRPVVSKKKEAADAENPPQRFYEPLRLRQERKRLWEEQVSNVVRLHEAGVPFSFRSYDLEKPSELLKNIRLAIQRGLPEQAAVAALTSDAAQLIGLPRQLGSIEKGRIANLTILSESLSSDKSQVKLVFVDGRKFEIAESERPNEAKETESKQAESTALHELSRLEAPALDTADWEVELKADRTPGLKLNGSVLIRNATILPITSEAIPRGSLLIRDGRIVAIGQDIEAPDGVTVIEGEGYHVLPGFVDCHSHLGIDAGNEWANSISSEVRIEDVLKTDYVGVYRAVAGGTTTHHVMHGSANPIGGQNAVLKLKYGRPVQEMLVRDGRPTIKFALGENVTLANNPKEWGKRYPSTRMGVDATIRGALKRAGDYGHEWDAYENAARAGQDLPEPRIDLRLEALKEVLGGTRAVHTHCYRGDEILRLIGIAEDFGFRIGVLQHVWEGYRVAPEIARHGAGASSFANMWAYKIEAFGAIPHNAAMMTRRGICTSINSDSPDLIRYLGQECAKTIKWGGLDTASALRLVTINPARQLGIDHRVGSLEVGKDGDVAIFNGHPLNTLSKCIMTIIEGEAYFQDDSPRVGSAPGAPTLPMSVDQAIPDTPHRAYAIINATLHPMSEPTIRRGTVVIVGDKIKSVGIDVSIPPGAGVIDAKGLHVYPGLIDAGSLLGLQEIELVRATNDHSEIGSRNPHLRAADAIHPFSEHIAITRAAGITTTLVTPSGKALAGQSAIIKLDGWTAPEMLRVESFALHLTVPSLPVHLPKDKVKKKKAIEAHKKAYRELDEFVEKAKHYAAAKQQAVIDSAEAFETDIALDAMTAFVTGKKRVVVNASTVKQILDALAFAKKHKLQVILAGGQESWKLADELARQGIPVILGTPLTLPSSEYEPWDAVYRCAAMLDRAGVDFCFASRSASSANDLGPMAGMSAAHGLSANKAERALTIGAARILGIDDRLGTLEVGKQADIIIATGSPLQTITRISHVFIDGKPIDLTNLQTDTYEKFSKRPKPVLPPPAKLIGPPSLTTPVDN